MTTNGRKLDLLATLAVAVGVLATELADLGWQPLWHVLARAAALVGGAMLVRLIVARLIGELGRAAWERGVVAAALVGVAWRLSVGPVPTEWLALEALRNAALAMLALPTAARIGRVAPVGVSLFLALACSVLGEHVGVALASVAFAVVGALWLSREGATTARPTVAAALVVGLGAALTAWGVHGEPAAQLAGLLPAWVNSSGGDRAGNDLARTGVGADGSDQLGGPNGDAGFDRSDFYCETDGQCLYDAFVEAYGEPIKSNADKAQWLKLSEGQIAEQRDENLRVGRDQEGEPPRRLSLRRAEKANSAAPGEAVLWAKADADSYPLRLPVLAFDHYHGGHWHEERDQAVMSAMDNAGADGYFAPIDQPAGDLWGAAREVAIGTTDYSANVLPLPSGLTRFRMGRVTRADLFASAAEPMLRVNRSSLPRGSVIEATYRPAWRAALANEPLAEVEPHGDHPASAELARRWAGELPRGWAQVDAVVAGLRQHAAYDPSAAFPSEADDHDHACPVETFLHDARRGDAYHFASAAVLMLRSLGYDARLAGGYYADAGDVDPASGKAIITKRHAHVWPQVRLAVEAGNASSRGGAGGIARGGQWVDLEPTPTFAVADGAPTAKQRAAAAWASVVAWVAQQWPVLAMATLIGAALVALRTCIIGGLDELLWRLRPTRDDRTFILRTLALLERRATRAGRSRPPCQSPARWLAPTGPAFASAVDWALHAPAGHPPPAGHIAPCRAAARPPHVPGAISPRQIANWRFQVAKRRFQLTIARRQIATWCPNLQFPTCKWQGRASKLHVADRKLQSRAPELQSRTPEPRPRAASPAAL